MAPKVVIFDMDDVLCHYDLGRRLKALADITGKDPREIRAALWDSGFEDEADSGSYPDVDDYLWELSVRLGYPVTRSEWIKSRRESVVPSEEVLKLARELSSGKTRVVMYSDTGPMVKSALDEIFPEAAEIFSEHYSAHEFGGKKGTAEGFTKLVEEIGVPAKDAWLIDDKKSNVKGALMAGLNAHHYRTYDALANDARELGFKVN